MRFLLMLVGLVLGLLVVRSFFLGPLEEVAFRLFAEAVQHVSFSAKTWQRIADTGLAKKFFIGGGAGAVLGFAVGSMAGGKKRR